MAITRGVRNIQTPFGEARVNDAGRVLWAEWEVWRHSSELVEQGLWTFRLGGAPSKPRSEYFVVEARS